MMTLFLLTRLLKVSAAGAVVAALPTLTQTPQMRSRRLDMFSIAGSSNM
jgi:hypothetical protein